MVPRPHIAFVLAAALTGGGAAAAEVTVRVHGVANDRGSVVVALCAADVFIGGRCDHRGAVPARPGTVPVVFPAVPPGTFGVRTYHDENANGRLDRNILGMPLEGYGFGNDARVVLSPPSFVDAAITVGEGRVETELTLRY